MTDCLKSIADNNVKYYSRDINAEAIKSRFYEVVNPKKKDKRTAEQIAEDIVARAGLVRKGGEG